MKKTLLVMALTLLMSMAASAEVVRVIGNTTSDDTPGGQYVIEKQTETRLRFRGGFYNEDNYVPVAQQGRFYNATNTRPEVGGKYYSPLSGAVVGSLGVYRADSEAIDPAEVEERATRGFETDDDAPFAALRRLFRIGSLFD